LKKFVAVLIVALLATGCFGRIVRDNGKNAAADTLKISFIANRGDNPGIQALSANFSTPQDYADNVFSRDVYREPFRDGSEGKLKGSFTPSSLIISLDSIIVSSPAQSMPLSMSKYIRRSPQSSWGILPNFDLAYADEIIDASYIIEDGDFDYDSISMTFFTRHLPGGEGPNQELSFVGEVRVDLGPEYKDVVFKNCKGITEDGLHVFEFADLIPMEGREHTVNATISFDHHVQESFIVNPDGSYVRDFRPSFWESPTREGLAGYVIYNPGIELDFRTGNHLVFEWDLVGLIEVYDNNSDDPAEHLVTFRLDNPFPISFYIEQLDTEPELPDEVPLKEVDHLDIGYFDLMKRQILLKWTNPALETFEQVRIIRSEGSAPETIDDGDEVYVGKFPIFEDFDVEEGRHYFYRVFVEDKYGHLSEGKVISVETNPPLVESIEFRDQDWRSITGPVNMTVGDTVTLWIKSNVNIAPFWEVDDDTVVAMEYEQGEVNNLTALQAGTAELRVFVPESFGGTDATLTIIVDEPEQEGGQEGEQGLPDANGQD